jgi:hypothetical protein
MLGSAAKLAHHHERSQRFLQIPFPILLFLPPAPELDDGTAGSRKSPASLNPVEIYEQGQERIVDEELIW